MIQAEAIIVIDRPIGDVFAFLADQHNAPQWEPTLLKVHRLTEGPIGVGTKHIAIRALMDDKLEVINEYVTFEPNREITLIGSDGLTKFRTSYLFEATSQGTKIINRMWIEPNEFTLMDENALVAMLEADFMASFQALKTLLEKQTTFHAS